MSINISLTHEKLEYWRTTLLPSITVIHKRTTLVQRMSSFENSDFLSGANTLHASIRVDDMKLLKKEAMHYTNLEPVKFENVCK